MVYQPNFTISNNLLTYIGRIEACRETINNAPLVPAWEAQFRENAMVRSVHHGTHLEGNELTKEQTEKIVQLDRAQGAEEAAEQADVMAKIRDIQEVINYRAVMGWIDENSVQDKKNIQYNEKILKTLHSLIVDKIVAPDKVGEYRKQQVVVRSVESGEIVYRPPLSVDVASHVSDFFSWLNSEETQELHSVLRAGITHYELVRIHPFIEGNGRTARAFAMHLLYAEGYDVKRFFSLEEYFDKDIEGYYKAILSVQKSQNLDMTYWLEYFSFGLAIELDKIKIQVLKLSSDSRLKMRLGTQVALSERQIILLEHLQENGQLTTLEANELIPMVSPDTILRDLKDLIDKKIIEKRGVTKGVSYTISKTS